MSNYQNALHLVHELSHTNAAFAHFLQVNYALMLMVRMMVAVGVLVSVAVLALMIGMMALGGVMVQSDSS